MNLLKAADHVAFIQQHYGLTPEQQMTRAEAKADYWDEQQRLADQRPGSYVRGAFKAAADDWRALAAAIRALIAGGSIAPEA